MNPYIEVVIPYEPCNQLGMAYNRAMEHAHDWVLLLDHDLFICNPNWNEACLSAIEKVGHEAGMITAVTNRIATGIQQSHGCPEHDDIIEHCKWAKTLWDQHGPSVIEIPDDLAGFFMLTHKAAWKSVGGFVEDAGFHVDGGYCAKIRDKGFKQYKMPGLYFYHLEKAKDIPWRYNKWKHFGVDFRIL